MTKLRFPSVTTLESLTEEIARLTRIKGLQIAVLKPNGRRKYRSDAEVKTIRKEYEEYQKKKSERESS